MNSNHLKIGIAGLGTVGVGTFKLLQANSDILNQRCGRRLEVTSVSALRREKNRGIDLDGVTWFKDGVDLATKADVDIVVEVIGGADGSARKTVESALRLGRHVVTANKALLANSGVELAVMQKNLG